MAVRPSMVKIIRDLRSLTDTAESQYQVNGVDYWTDEQLQDTCDKSAFILMDTPLSGVPMMYSGVLQVKDFYLPRSVPKDLELVVHPEATQENPTPDPLPVDEWRLQIVDSSGHVIQTPYVYHIAQGLFRFTSPINVSAMLYVRGYAYNLNLIASQIWTEKASHTATLVEFKAGQTTVKDNQEHQHCLNMAKHYKRKAGVVSVKQYIRGYHG